jgi:Mor family transcriptional regulator
MIAESDILISDLPPLVADFAETLGMKSAMLIVKHYSNKRLAIPLKRINPHMLEVLGEDLTSKLMFNYGGCQWMVPMCAKLTRKIRNSEILADSVAGKTVLQLAEKYSLSYRQIGEILHAANLALDETPPVRSLPDGVDLSRFH